MEPTPAALRAFLAVAEHRHYGRAARALHVSGPALSQQISRLERLVGAALFDRSTRQVTLTDAGTRLIPLARDLVEANRRISLWDPRAGDTTLHIGFTDIGPPRLTAAVFSATRERLPGLKLDFHHVRRDELVQSVADGTLGGGFVWRPVTHDDSIRYAALVSEERVAVLNDQSRLANGIRSLEDLVPCR